MPPKKRKSGQDDDLPADGFDSRSQPFPAADADADEDDDISAASPVGGEDDITDLIAPLTRDQLVSILRSAAASDPSILAKIRCLADIEPSHRKLFVHGLGWDTDADTLQAAYAPYGEIEECRVVIDKSSGKSRGYGFILFRYRISARAALRRPQKLIDGRMTSCQLASIGPVPSNSASHTVSGQNNFAAPDHAPPHDNLPRKIYVGNVHESIDGDRLRSFFSSFGEIDEGPIGFDRRTGKPKGFALFVYKTVEGARRALEEPNKNFEGNLLYCQKATDSGKSRGGGSGGGGGYAGNSFSGSGTNASSGLGAYNGSGYGVAASGEMGLAAQQAALLGQGLLGMTAGQAAFGQGMQPNAATLALLAAAGQNPAAFGLNPMLASLNPAAIAAALGAGGQPVMNPSVVSTPSAQGYVAGYQNVGFQGPPGFQGQLPAAQQSAGGGVGAYQAASMGGQNARTSMGQMGGGYGQH